MNTWIRSALAGLLGLAGCASPPENLSSQHGLELPDHYLSAPTHPPTVTGWLDDFNDPELSRLVLDAQTQNYDLQAAAARLRSARANLTIAGANRLPTLSAQFGASRTKRAQTTGFQLSSPRSDRFDLGATFAWEADLWGRYLNREQAAIADFEASQADFNAAQLSLAANTAKAWFNAIESSQQLTFARSTVQSFQTNLTVVNTGFLRGVNSALDVRLSRANVAAAQSNVQLRQRQQDAAIRSLQVLLGRYPSDAIDLTPNLPQLHNPVPSGLPSDLLNRRPDLVAAERRLAASHENLKSSRKALLPSISLTATGGTTSQELKDLLDIRNLIWSLAANLTQPLFQGGRLRADIEIAEAQSDEALATFAQSVLLAFQEVETTLAAEEFLADQETSLRLAATESKAAEDIAWQEYQRGLADLITVLESQRRAVNAQSSLIEISNQRLQNRLNLYLALGGEFQVDHPTSASRSDTP